MPKIYHYLSLFPIIFIFSCSAFAQDQLPPKDVRYFWLKGAGVVKNPDSCTYYAKQGLALARQLQDKKGMADMHYLIAYTHSIANTNNDLVLSNAQTAINLYQELKQYDRLGNCLFLIGRLEYLKGHFPQATQYLINATNASEKANKIHDVLNSQLLLSQLYGEHNEYDKHLRINQHIFQRTDSLLTYHHELPVNERNILRQTHAKSAINLGNAYQHQNQYETAIRYYQLALDHLKEGPNIADQALVQSHMASCYAKLKQHDLALKLGLEAIRLSRECKSERTEALSLQNMARIEPDFIKALAYINRAIRLAKSADNKDILTQMYETKSEISAKNQSFQEAYEAKVKQMRLNDSLFNVDKAKQIARLESVNQLEKTRKALHDLELTNYRNQILRYAATIVAVILLLATLIVFVYYRKLRKLHQKVVKQRSELEQLNQTKSKIFSVIGHDLRSPMNSVITLCYLLRQKDNSPDQVANYLEMLEERSASSVEILNKLTAWGSMEFNETNYVREIDLAEVIHDGVKEMNRIALSKRIHIDFKPEWTPRILFNPFHLDFILRNLLQNAIKFTAENGTISLAFSECLQGQLKLDIADTGIGMTAEVQKTLMSDIVTSHRGTSGETGLGIGLMLCYHFALKNNSQLSFTSVEGHGTTFTLTLNCI